MMLAGEEDAYGHRKLGGIGALTGELLKGEPASRCSISRWHT